jgi:hypothetical protein
MKIGVCIRAKDEQNIISTWVKYYIQLGFDKIVIYDNMSNPSIEETLRDNNMFDQSKVEIIIDSIEYSNQPIIYQECINNNKDLDWLLLCDADEFLYIKDWNIKDFLNQYSEDTSTIVINWIVYGTSKLLTYDNNKTVFEQFTKRESYNHFWNIFVKSFIRPKLIDTFGNVHITINNKYKVKNVYNEECIKYSDNNKCDYKDDKLSDNTPLVIVHYMTLDFESMWKKHNKNINGFILEKSCNKYSLEWYKSRTCGFKDDYLDERMLKFI